MYVLRLLLVIFGLWRCNASIGLGRARDVPPPQIIPILRRACGVGCCHSGLQSREVVSNVGRIQILEGVPNQRKP